MPMCGINFKRWPYVVVNNKSMGILQASSINNAQQLHV